MNTFRKAKAMAFSMRGSMGRALSTCHARPKKYSALSEVRNSAQSSLCMDEIGSTPESESTCDRRTSISSANSNASTDIVSNVSTDSSCSSLFSYVNMNMSEDALEELAQQEVQAEKFRSMIARRRSTGAGEERILKHYEKCLADTLERIRTLRSSAGTRRSSDSLPQL